MTAPRRGFLALEDGRVFRGVAFGAEATVTGEACFNTGMTGYQEVLTDPSYHGQIVTMTASQIGNTGVNDHDDQAARPWAAAFVVKALSSEHSSWRATGSLDAYLHRAGVPALSDVDTRALARHLRSRGAMRAALSTLPVDSDELVDRARSSPTMVGRDLATEVTTTTSYRWGREQVELRAASGFAAGAERSPATRRLAAPRSWSSRFRIAAYDFGLKRNILDLLVASGYDVTVFPAHTPAAAIVADGYDGVFLSNGPGDPEPLTYAVAAVRDLLGKIPVFGICLGHQILSLAAGAQTYKLLFGHRGSNHPVKQVGDNRVEITCQNHGFAVDPSGTRELRTTHLNLNDATVEGVDLPGLAFSVQYHPEAGPGPHDSRYLFARFGELIEGFDRTRPFAALT